MTDYQFPADVPTRAFHEEVTAVYGGRGSGKTTKAKQLVIDNAPAQVVWIDPTLQADTSPAEFRAAIERGDKMIQVGATHPDAAIGALLTAYGLSTKTRPLYVVCDEAATYLKTPRPSLSRVFNMGRHAGMGVLLITQRPSGIHPDFRGQAARTFWGRLTDHNDIALASQALGKEQGQSRAAAQVGDFIEKAN